MADQDSLLFTYVEKSGAKPQMPLMEALSILKNKIEMAEKINADLAENFEKWGKGAFTKCPNCESDTLLEFVACHWCEFMLIDSTRPTNEVTLGNTPEKKSKAVKAQMGSEPAATINFGGVPSKTEEPKAPQAETPVEDKLKLLNESKKLAALKETGAADLKKINELAALNIDVASFKKMSLFRQAVIDGLDAAIQALKVEEPAVEEKPKAKRASKGKKGKGKDDGDEVLDSDPTPFVDETKGKKKAKVVEIDESELEDEKPKKGKANLAVVANEDDELFGDDDEGDEDVDADEDTAVVSSDDDFDDVDLASISVDDLKDDEDFDLENDD